MTPFDQEPGTAAMVQLWKALVQRECLYTEAIDRLREIATQETENEVFHLTAQLRECIELARCLRRLTHGRTVEEIHTAFGAPGDFGYDTPIGDALLGVYWEESDSHRADPERTEEESE